METIEHKILDWCTPKGWLCSCGATGYGNANYDAHIDQCKKEETPNGI